MAEVGSARQIAAGIICDARRRGHEVMRTVLDSILFHLAENGGRVLLAGGARSRFATATAFNHEVGAGLHLFVEV